MHEYSGVCSSKSVNKNPLLSLNDFHCDKYNACQAYNWSTKVISDYETLLRCWFKEFIQGQFRYIILLSRLCYITLYNTITNLFIIPQLLLAYYALNSGHMNVYNTYII